MSSDGNGPNDAAESGSFDDAAIRSELRNIVKRDEAQFMEKMNDSIEKTRTEYDALQDVDEDAKQKFFAKFEAAKSVGQQRFKMMLDYIERH